MPSYRWVASVSCAVMACTSSSGDADNNAEDTQSPDALDGGVITDTSTAAEALDGDAPTDTSTADTPTVVDTSTLVDAADSGPPSCTSAASGGVGSTPATRWAKLLGGVDARSAVTRVEDVAIDATSGDVLVVGNFSGTVNLGGADLVPHGARDMFFARYDRDGNLIFLKTFGAPSAYVTGQAIVLDGAGGLFVAGTLDGSASLGGATLKSDSIDFVLARYSSADGSHVWSKVIGSKHLGSLIRLRAMPGGKLLFGSNFEKTIDFGGGLLTSAGGFDAALASFDAATGAHLWSKRYGSTSDEGLYDMVLDGAGNVFAIGAFTGSATDLGLGPLTSGAATNSAFAARLDGTGKLVWNRTPTGSDAVFRSIAIGPDGMPVIAGYFLGPTLSIGGCALTTEGMSDAVLVKLDPDGNPRWTKSLGGTEIDRAQVLAIDAAGVITLAGTFNGSASFGGAAFVATGSDDPFVASFGADGGHLRSEAFLIASPNQMLVQHLASLPGGGTLLTGQFAGTATIGPFDLPSHGSPATTYDVFMAAQSP